MKKRLVTIGLIALWISHAATNANARTYSPRVVSEHNADSYSMKTFAQHSSWRDLRGSEKAWQMFKYLTDYQTGLYPMGEGTHEGPESLYEYSLVRDPVKMINVYSIGYCDVFGPVMAGIWQDAGLGKARTVDLPGLNHVASEVYYENDWYYFDLDMRAAFRRNDGSLATLEQSQYDLLLWNQPNEPRFFPLDDLTDIRNAYQDSELQNRYGLHESGHTMDFMLRQGESFTRWWEPQGGRWLHHSNYDEDLFVKDLINTEPRGRNRNTRHSLNSHMATDSSFTNQILRNYRLTL